MGARAPRARIDSGGVSAGKVTEVRPAELIAALSLATDLGLGQPMKHVLRSCRISLRLADELGLDDDERAVTYYVSLLAWICCHADAKEQAAWFGDDIALRPARRRNPAVGVDRGGSDRFQLLTGDRPSPAGRLE